MENEARPSCGPTSGPRRDLLSLSFSAMVVTQFLGAFNDNAFKQLILLWAIDVAGERGGGSYQAIATALFALPFLLFSGIAGSLSDRVSKTRVIVLAKVAEVLIMGLGVIAFLLRSLDFVLFTLFLMGSQSAFFGPAKYGILPQMVPDRSLSRANGVILMTTFVAIILGMAGAGWLRDIFPLSLHRPAWIYVLLALVGTATALCIRHYPAARPDLRIRGRPLGDLWPTLLAIGRDPFFLVVICAQSFFWFLGGVMLQALNLYGRELMALSNLQTSLLLVTLQAGMAMGGIAGAAFSRKGINFRLTDWGSVGMICALTALTGAHASIALVHVTLFLLGVSGTLFSLPLQTYVQHRPLAAEKGRVVAAANFVNWVFIFLSAPYFWIAEWLLPVAWIPGSLAVLVVLIDLSLRRRLRSGAAREGEPAA